MMKEWLFRSLIPFWYPFSHPISYHLPTNSKVYRHRRVLVRIAAIIGLIKARAFEHDGGAGADQSTQFVLRAFGTLALDGVGHRLEQLEFVAASVADVIVSRHAKGFGVRD